MAEAIGRSARTLETLFAHPVPANLHWSDVLTLIQRFGSVEHHRHGNLHVDIAGHRLTLKHSNEKQLDKEQATHLRTFLEGLGITRQGCGNRPLQMLRSSRARGSIHTILTISSIISPTAKKQIIRASELRKITSSTRGW